MTATLAVIMAEMVDWLLSTLSFKKSMVQVPLTRENIFSHSDFKKKILCLFLQTVLGRKNMSWNTDQINGRVRLAIYRQPIIPIIA